MSETAFEKFWERSRFESCAMSGEYLEAQEIWNAAMDAAAERCRYIRDTSIKACESNTSENCRAEIQKLRSE